ncbi:MAG: hypothetical protein AVDCRST_MAG48-1408, partial [uncultured Friedmanniella sp.]
GAGRGGGAGRRRGVGPDGRRRLRRRLVAAVHPRGRAGGRPRRRPRRRGPRGAAGALPGAPAAGAPHADGHRVDRGRQRL